ncbi:peptidoglycan-binding protein [Luteibacter aegosomaticola]|uniref:XVIPCD domain-containing protein n=1 Tax=Luteibacter aegosomaticola TaxID=2911538 RepID=UPI001FFAF11F|nr:XVIPCD domain-containing protein [Luteibacter aegosomaticola]UPG91581.1 peptidoglycan-binding protein [Luteibacter aegosomaticola]
MTAKENADFLMSYAQAHGITDKKELANFMGQMTVESGNFKSMDENLNYSGDRLHAVFPGRNGMNTVADANKVAAGGPEAIANKIYGGDWGEDNLGNTQPGDGWKFHGRGFVQLTGRDNYDKAANGLGMDLVHHPELAADRDNAAKIAVYYWQSRVIPKGHETDVDNACHDINGGHKGLPERRTAAKAWEEALEKGYKPGGPEPLPTGAGVGHAASESLRHAQQMLNQQGYHTTDGKPLGEDGRMGPQTKQAIEAFQRDHGLKADGIVGKNTLHELEKAQAPRAPHAPNTTPTQDQRAHEQHAHTQPGVQPLPYPHTQANPATQGAPRLDDPTHPGNPLYKEALASVQRLDAAQGRTTDQVSRQFAGAVATEAYARGLTHVDHIVLSDNGAKAYAVQGELNSPFKQLAEVNTQQAVSTPLEQSSQQWQHAQTQQQANTHAQTQAQAQAQPTPQQAQEQQPSMQR